MFVGVGKESGQIVPEEEAFKYAIGRVITDQKEWDEFKEAVVDWYFSGSWIKED